MNNGYDLNEFYTDKLGIWIPTAMHGIHIHNLPYTQS